MNKQKGKWKTQQEKNAEETNAQIFNANRTEISKGQLNNLPLGIGDWVWSATSSDEV